MTKWQYWWHYCVKMKKTFKIQNIKYFQGLCEWLASAVSVMLVHWPETLCLQPSTPVFKKTCATTQKNVKSHVFWISKKRKNRKKRTYNFSRLFNVYCSSSLLSESVTAQRFHAMFSNGSEWITLADLGTKLQWSLNMWTHFDGLRTKLLLTIFTTSWYVISKKRKKSCFLKSEKT